MPQLIDTHGHVSFEAFKNDYRTILNQSLAKGIWTIMPGTQKDTSKRAVEVANEFDEGVYAAVGIHPLHLLDTELDQEEISFHARAERFDDEYYQTLAQNPKVKAIGECGPEYFRIQEHSKKTGIDTENLKKNQQETYEKHVQLACELNLPIITHCRASEKNASDAYDDLVLILRRYPSARGVIHCFTSSFPVAQKFLDLGFYISFTGIITFAKEQYLLDAVREIPLDRILIETDAPYLSPTPHRGKRNLPEYVTFVAEKIAHIKGTTFERTAEQTVQNSKNLFKI